jgi:flagellar basal body-associated protein FliL
VRRRFFSDKEKKHEKAEGNCDMKDQIDKKINQLLILPFIDAIIFILSVRTASRVKRIREKYP